MNNQLSIHRKASFYFGLALFTSLGFALPALGEGSQQLGNGSQGLNVYLFEYNATNSFVQTNQGPRPIKVNVENANQVINISLCGWNTADILAIEVFRPSGTEIDYTKVAAASPGAFDATAAGGAGAWRLTTGNARNAAQTTLCNNQSNPNQPNGTLSTPVRFVAPEAGTYEIRLHNDSLAADNINNVFTYFDVTVTPNASTNPDPRANKGQVWATSWAFNAGNTFTAAGGYDADLYIRTPGGRPNTGFVWQLDLNKFAPQRHEIIANGIGLDAPNSRGSAPGSSGATYTKNYPIYLSPPSLTSLVAPILPEPAPPSISNLRFIDNAGEDNTISPTSTTGVQDSGFFRFNSDVAGTYKITIDTNQDGVFGTGDRVLFGSATSGANAVVWDGKGDNDAVLNPGSYPAQVTVGLGEYHFVTFDAETSGGGTNDGLSIWKWNGSSRSAISNFWDDTKIISSAGATRNLVGGLSGTPAGTHTWGNFDAGSIGDTNYLDTWVFGTPQILTTKTIITTSDANDFGDAPDTYGTNKDITVGGTPASHLFNPNLSLGVNAPDRDADGQPSVNADGDDINGTIPDDEDGVISFSPLIKNATTYSVKVRVKNITGAAASLGGWIDFNKDGQFQSSEGVVQSVPNNTNSDVTLTWNSLSGLVVGDIYARFRLNSDPLTTSDFNGGGRDGEVEDYKLAIQEVDYGDAPDTYGTDKTANNSSNTSDPVGASHIITSGLFLGATVPDADTNGFVDGIDNNGNATDDDAPIGTGTGNGDDEDNFTLPTLTAGSTSYTIPASNIKATNTTTQSATIHAWIDFNKNGKFDSTEYASAAVNQATNGGNPQANLTWSGITVGATGNTYARFRLTSDTSVNGNTPNGAANNGEVEDYQIAIAPAPLYDYGDAPDTSAGTGTGNYQTRAADGGAAQVVINTAGRVLSIGNNIDIDNGSLQNSNADADDTSGTPNDEDGVSSFPTLTTIPGQTYTVRVTARNNVPNIPAYLVGFIDFNKDGDFLDTGEQSNTVTITPDALGNNGELRTFNVTFTTPAGMTPGDTYARFRLGQVQATAKTATGASAGTDNGEVEDYKVAIATPPVAGSPFTCDSSLYIVFGNTGGTPFSQLNRINRSINPFTFDTIGTRVNNYNYNALAYNPVDNYMYAVVESANTSSPFQVGEILKIGSSGVPISLGKPQGDAINYNPNAGTFLANGTYVVGRQTNPIYTINVTTTPPTATLKGVVTNTVFEDFAVNPYDKTLNRVYGIEDNSDRLVYFNLNNTGAGATAAIAGGNATGNRNHGSQFYDLSGNLLYRSADTNALYIVNPDGRDTFLANTPSGGSHDGASCFAVGLEKKVDATNPVPAGQNVTYTYRIGNASAVAMTVTLTDDLRSVADYPNNNINESDTPVNGTYTGTVNKPSGTVALSNNKQTLTISGITLAPQSFTTITAEVTIPRSASPATYYNQATVKGLPPGFVSVVGSDFPTSATYEDPTPLSVTEALNPNLLLVKRITAINPGQSDEVRFNSFVNDDSNNGGDPNNDPDNDPNWPNGDNTYLRGAVNIKPEVAVVEPGDEVEYTIYFLSNGEEDATNVKICDLIPNNMTFVSNSYDGDSGIALLNSSASSVTATELSNAADTDEGTFIAPGITPVDPGDGSPLCKKPAPNDPDEFVPVNATDNVDGIVVVKLDSLPKAEAPGTPANSYGFIRFRARVK